MGMFDDLIPQSKQASGTGMFDDLIPQDKQSSGSGMFDDLIPAGNKPTPQQIEAMATKSQPTAAELEAASKPAISYKAPMPDKAKVEEARQQQEKENIPFDQLHKNPEFFNIVKDYMKVSRGVEQAPEETDEDFVKKYMSTMRNVELNTFMGKLPELNRMRNANDKDAETMGLGQELYSRTQSAFRPGGQGYGSMSNLRPYYDAITSLATDPLNYVGAVGGKLGGQIVKVAAAREAGNLAASAAAKGKIAQMLTPTVGKVRGAITGLEGASGAGQSVIDQRLKQETNLSLGQEVEDLSAGQILFGAILGAGSGYIDATAATKAFGKTGREQFDKIISSKTPTPTAPNAPPTKIEQVLLDPVSQNMDDLAEEFMKQEGAKVLDEISPAAALVEPAIRRDLSERAIRVAMNIIENDPDYKLKIGQKTSTAIADVFSAIDQGLISDTLLEQAIVKEGLSPRQFAQANKVTVTQAAQIMQQYSAAAKTLNRFRKINPEVAKQVDALYGTPDEYTTSLGYLGKAFSRLERESKALIVSGIGTTVRNVLGTGVGLTFNSAASLIEGSLMTVGKVLSQDAKGARVTTLKSSLSDTIKDSFGTWGYLAKNDLAGEVTDELLKHNPTIKNNILSAMQENDTDLSKLSRMVNALNVSQDVFFRKAIFANSVEKKLRGVGLDMYQLIADGKVIPADILKEAADDTLKATFSYTPKITKGGGLEAGAETIGNYFVKAAEFPGGSLFAAFPRFMSNAIAFQYRYSALGGLSGAEDVIRGAKMMAAGDETGASLIRKGQTNIAKGVVGISALMAAIDYRQNNQDVEWGTYKKDDGSTVDLRSIFPIGPYLAIADVVVKYKRGLEVKTGDAFESIIGMKMPAGTQNQFMDQLLSALSSEKSVEKWADKIGKVIGDFGGRFVAPSIVKDIFNLVDLMRENGSIARDPNVIKSDKAADRILEAAGNRIQSKLPVLKEGLPEAVPRGRQGPIYREGEFFNNLVGIRVTTKKTPEETELVNLGIDAYKLFGASSGDKEYDRTYVENANPLVIGSIQRAMNDPRYQDLPDIEKKVAIENTVSKVLPLADKMTNAKFSTEDLNRVFKMKFNKLSDTKRKIINRRYAEDNDGVTLEEADDYMQYKFYEATMKDLQFAVGGIVAGKIAKAGAKSAAKRGIDGMLDLIKKVKKPSASVSSDINNIVDDVLDEAVQKTKESPVMDQMTNMLSKKPTPQAMTAPVKPAIDDVAPIPPAQVMDAPAPSKAFADEDYVKGEEAMLEMYSPEQLKSWKIANSEDYENTLHSFTGQAKGLKYSEMPPQPFAKKTDEAAESLVDEVEYDMDGNPVSVGGKAIVKKAEPIADEYGVDPKYLSGDANTIAKKTSVAQRNAAVSAIKETREDSFFKMRNNDKFASVDDDVLGVVLGDYRYSRGVELNPKDPEMLADAMKLAGQYQKRLETLREKYKDVPPVKLFHGQGATSAIEPIKKSGFTDPSKRDEFFHSEMMVGAPSFTKDLNLGFRGTPFGGTRPENYVVTEIPYADYVFNKINMAPDKYDNKDLNTILRAVTGAPGVVRPIGLPRAGFLETEDMMLEAEKLRVKGANAKLRSGEKDVAKVLETGGKGLSRASMKGEEEVVSEYMKLARTTPNPKEKMKLAYMSYTGIKDLMNNYLDMATATSTKSGLGQQYQAAINNFADYSGIQRQMREVGDILWDGGAKQKAQNLYELSDKLKKFQQSEPAISTAVDESKRVKPLDEVRKFIPKLAKGGLATRRQ